MRLPGIVGILCISWEYFTPFLGWCRTSWSHYGCLGAFPAAWRNWSTLYLLWWQRRRPPGHTEEDGQGIHGHSEEYTHEGTPKINFVGWTAQPVLYESDALHHKRSFGAHCGGFLRITLCLLHSALIPVPLNSERQSAGLHEYVYTPPRQAPIDGSPEDSAKLSESFMLLESAVGLPYWDFSHVRGDSGDAINDVTPWRNKKRVKSFLLPRKDISSCRWRDSLSFSLSLSFSSGWYPLITPLAEVPGRGVWRETTCPTFSSSSRRGPGTPNRESQRSQCNLM